MRDFTARGEPFSGFQNRHVTKDGRMVILETSGVPVFDDNGRFRGYRGIDRDVTSRKLGEEERARLKMAVDQAAESILITEPDGRIVYVNPAFEKITGYDGMSCWGEPPGYSEAGDTTGLISQVALENHFAGGAWPGITNRKKDGSLYEEEMVISPVRDCLRRQS